MAIDFGNSTEVLSSLINLFKVPPAPAPPIPSVLVLASVNRPGLSPTKISANIIKRQAEAGLPVGPLPSGDESTEEKMERIRIEEIVRALTEDAKITVATNIGQTVLASGGNAGGPVVVVGTTTSPGSGFGVIQ